MPESTTPPLTPEAEEAGHDPTKVSEPTPEQLKDGVLDADGPGDSAPRGDG